MPNSLIDRIPTNMEVRASAGELRADPELGTFSGHASMFNTIDSYGTSFDKKAFNKTLADKRGRIPILFFHNPEEMVGPAKELRADDQGLYFEGKAVDDGRTGTYVLAHLRGGTPMGMSHGFRTISERAATKKDPIDLSTAPWPDMTIEDVRVITEVELYEISTLPWVFASNEKADIGNIRANAQRQTIDEVAMHAAYVTDLLNAIKDGTLNEERAVLVQQLVTAWQDTHAEPEHPAPLTDILAPLDERTKDDILRTLSRSRLILTGVTPTWGD